MQVIIIEEHQEVPVQTAAEIGEEVAVLAVATESKPEDAFAGRVT